MTDDAPEVWVDFGTALRLEDLPPAYLEHLEPHTVLSYSEMLALNERVRLTNNALSLVRAERNAQDAQWGTQDHPDGTGPAFNSALGDARRNMAEAQRFGVLSWRDILLEEVFEALCEQDAERLGEELTQLAAVAVAWREALHRRGTAPVQPETPLRFASLHTTQVNVANPFWGGGA
ncbi:hypothetical protein [Lentzea sp. CC55]|uniref:hypothetical protein n=1 Tax=Lentzea sp. CC55 TaxID=2884909 RepID=UPI001F3DCCA6|nr:hypothetical protein [Lentzea sp. CC55]MCG8926677.1 hypothetical protein [Lentzea sp. CC55]